MTTTRLHHPRGWYADVPVAAATVLGDALSTVAVTTAPTEPDGPHVQLRGVVVERVEGDAVVSCYGLMARGPGETTRVGENVCVTLFGVVY